MNALSEHCSYISLSSWINLSLAKALSLSLIVATYIASLLPTWLTCHLHIHFTFLTAWTARATLIVRSCHWDFEQLDLRWVAVLVVMYRWHDLSKQVINKLLCSFHVTDRSESYSQQLLASAANSFWLLLLTALGILFITKIFLFPLNRLIF